MQVGRHVVRCSLLLALLYLVGEPSSPFFSYLNRYLGLNLTWLTRPLMVYVALRLPASILLEGAGRGARALSYSLTALALSYLAYDLLGGPSRPFLYAITGWLLRRISRLSGRPWVKASVNALGITSIAYGSRELLRYPLKPISSLALKAGLEADLSYLSPLSEALAAIADPFFLGLEATAIASLLSPLSSSGSELLARLGGWASASQLRNFLLGFLLGVYALRVRPYLLANWAYVRLIEWLALGLAVARIVDGLRTKLKSLTAEEPLHELYRWERPYELKVEVKRGEEVKVAEELVGEFLNRGLKARLIAYIAVLLHEMGAPLRVISYVIEPIASHADKPVPLIAFGFEKDLVIKSNRSLRERALSLTLARLAEWAESRGVKLRWYRGGRVISRGKG